MLNQTVVKALFTLLLISLSPRRQSLLNLVLIQLKVFLRDFNRYVSSDAVNYLVNPSADFVVNFIDLIAVFILQYVHHVQRKLGTAVALRNR